MKFQTPINLLLAFIVSGHLSLSGVLQLQVCELAKMAASGHQGHFRDFQRQGGL